MQSARNNLTTSNVMNTERHYSTSFVSFKLQEGTGTTRRKRISRLLQSLILKSEGNKLSESPRSRWKDNKKTCYKK
jgi:hypothetical protein